jgi:ABC-2 type transport system permease protein
MNLSRDLGTIFALWKREMIRFTRQPGRMAGAIGQPLLLWIFLGAGIGQTFQMKGSLPADMTYTEFFFPGMIVMVLLFTAIFSTISVIEDRQEGLLRTVLIAPVSRYAIVVGKGLGGVTVAMLQGGVLLLFLLTPYLSFALTLPRLLFVLLVMALISIGFTAMGFCMAWFFESSQSYHGMMSFFLIPLWMLSGALFPVNNLPAWLDVVMKLNPLTYGLEALRCGFYTSFAPPASLVLQTLNTDLVITVAFTGLMVVAAVGVTLFKKEPHR